MKHARRCADRTRAIDEWRSTANLPSTAVGASFPKQR